MATVDQQPLPSETRRYVTELAGGARVEMIPSQATEWIYALCVLAAGFLLLTTIF